MDYCVCCGRSLPTECGSQVCRTCELTAGIKFMQFKCPVCGNDLDIYYKDVVEYHPSKWDSYPYLAIDLIYHCHNCGCDWDSEYTQDYGDESQLALKRHYWG